MNLNRSSSNPTKLSSAQIELLKLDIRRLLAGPSNLEVKADGRIFIKSLNKYYMGGGSIKLDLVDKNGLLCYSFPAISECTKFSGISAGTIAKRFRDNKAICVADTELYIRNRRDSGSIVE